jgi:chorismate mutase
MKTIYFKQFKDNIEHIQNSTKCDYSLKLFYANLVTIMESYLSDIFIETVSTNLNLMEKLTKSNKYKNQNVNLYTALTNDMKRYIIGLIKQIVFHNLSNIRPLFREVLDIGVTNEQEILDLIEKRHHIIHRNGFDKSNNPVQIREEDIETTINSLTNYIERIDQQFIDKFQTPTA